MTYNDHEEYLCNLQLCYDDEIGKMYRCRGCDDEFVWGDWCECDPGIIEEDQEQ